MSDIKRFAHRPVVARAAEKADGSLAALARDLSKISGQKVTRQRVENWLRRDARLPPEAARWISEYLDDPGIPARVRPDVFGGFAGRAA